MNKIPVHGLIPLLQESTELILERFADADPVPNVFGEAVSAAPTLISTAMVAHQATRQQLERAGLDYGPDWRAFYSQSELRTTTPGPADVVQYQSERWELHNSADYAFLGGVHIALGRRIE